MRERGIKLTLVGHCCNPKCGRPRFLELGEDLSEACLDCDQPREGLPTAFRMAAATYGMEVTPETTVSELFEKLPPHCSEDCCRGDWIEF